MVRWAREGGKREREELVAARGKARTRQKARCGRLGF